MSESYAAFRDQLLSRHENGITSVLSTVGDVVVVGGIASAVLTRRVEVGLVGATIGLAVAAAAHLFQPGTLRDELTANLRHPLWALRAEGQRVLGGRT
jgi:hypothetical protein